MNDPLFDLKIKSLITNPSANIQTKNAVKPTSNFDDILANKIKANSSIEFSRHAINRVMERNIDMSPQNIERLNRGVQLAQEKGLNETLILIDRTAFIVNVNNNKVITMINENSKEQVITNIDGAVIV